MMDACMMDACMHACMYDGCMHALMDACMHV